MKNIYDIFAEHIRKHINDGDKSKREISPMSGVCPFCEKTMHRVYKDVTGKDWKI